MRGTICTVAIKHTFSPYMGVERNFMIKAAYPNKAARNPRTKEAMTSFRKPYFIDEGLCITEQDQERFINKLVSMGFEPVFV